MKRLDTWTAVAVGLLGIALASPAARASEIVDVLPLTDQILLVHFDDGHVIHHKAGRPRGDEQVVVSELDVKKASAPSTYRIASDDDAAYTGGKQPGSIGRKSKGTDYAWFVDKFVNGRAVNDRPDHAKEHWVYLFLPSPMQRGKTYTLSTGDLATNGGEWKLTFDERQLRSEAVHVNLVGYAPAAPQKFGYVYAWMGDKGSLDLKSYENAPFSVIPADGQGEPVLKGTLKFRAPADRQETFHKTDSPPHGSFLKADVYECDLSALNTPGEYVLVVDRVGRSFPFKIDPDVYRDVFVTTARGLYHNRSGIALEQPYTEFTRPAPGNPNLTPNFADKLVYTRVRWSEWGSEGGDAKKLLAESPGTLTESWGWYQDAGDWDGYYSHLRVPKELLLAYEIAPANFKDGELNIPEGTNGVPDVLDEATWLVRFCYRQRHELMDKGYGTGGLGTRVAPDAFGSDEGKAPDGTNVGRGSWQDDRIYAVSGEDPWSTLGYAGLAAHLAYCLDIADAKDPQGVDWAKEAQDAWEWAQKNFRPTDDQNSEQTRHVRSYAAAALFRVTGDRKYQDQFIKDTQGVQAGTLLWDDARFGPAVYALGGGKGKQDPQTLQRVRAAVLSTADSASIDTAGKRSLRWGGNFYMPMLIGQQTTPWMLEAAIGYAVARQSDPAKAKQYLAAMYTSADYFMGTNALNMTFITGVGPRHPQHPFHMDAWYNGKDQVHPGIIPYGNWRKQTEFGTGPWDVAWAHKTVYPGIDEWPGNERFFDNRCSPMGAEFTVHQNIGPAAAFYGILCAPGPAAAK